MRSRSFSLRRLASRAFFLTSLLLFLFTVNCGVNYYRRPFSAEAGIEIGEHSVGELAALCERLTLRVNESAQAVYSEGPASDNSPLSMRELSSINEAAQAAMTSLGERFPCLSSPYPRPKPVLFSPLLSVQHLAGIYSPFTVEANYNREMTSYNIPHTACHELSHLKGFMREDEANFIGFLACISSPDPRFQYSGFLLGWIYATNALYDLDPAAYWALHDRLDERAAADLRANTLFWNRYDGRLAEASTQLNDAYLKAHSQTDGVRSYGRIVDLMLSYGWEGVASAGDGSPSSGAGNASGSSR